MYIDKNISIDDKIIAVSGKYYEVGDSIGRGGNGVVYSCTDNMGIEYAVKFLIKTTPERITRFKQEIVLMQKASHPHLIKYIDNGEAPCLSNGRNQSIEFVVMEKADNNLLNYAKNNEEIDYSEYVPQFRGLCGALGELHKYAIHRDIKPENILIKGDTWVLSDFGLCKFILPEFRNDITTVNEKVGPVFWMSPEAIDSYYWGNNDIVNTYSDVFQLCSVFAFLLSHKYPGGIIDETYDMRTTPEIKDVILKSMSNNYRERPQNGNDLLKCFVSALSLGEINQ